MDGEAEVRISFLPSSLQFCFLPPFLLPPSFSFLPCIHKQSCYNIIKRSANEILWRPKWIGEDSGPRFFCHAAAERAVRRTWGFMERITEAERRNERQRRARGKWWRQSPRFVGHLSRKIGWGEWRVSRLHRKSRSDLLCGSGRSKAGAFMWEGRYHVEGVRYVARFHHLWQQHDQLCSHGEAIFEQGYVVVQRWHGQRVTF